ncbi:MAG: PDZ domain-containing protein [Bacteroidota bacterium]|nr:PDZ domain-containing protein [Bacteroidota bacterium]
MKSRLVIVALLLVASALSFADNGDKQIRTKSKKQGWLGVGIQDVTPKFARENELKIKEGAYINEVVDESPADSAGLKKGDVVVDFNSKKIETSEDLSNAVRETKPGTKATVKINRNGESKSISVNIGKNKIRMPFALNVPRAPRVVVNMFGGDIEGMDLMELNKQLAEYFEAPNAKGVLVKEVEKDENAATAGIKAGDVITKVGDEVIKDIGDVRDAIADLEEGDKVNIELIRKGKKTTVSLEISENEMGDDMFWRGESPEHFNFHFEPQMEMRHKELQEKMKELPQRQIELRRLESKLRSSEV